MPITQTDFLEISKEFGLKRPRKGTPRMFVFKTTDVWTFEEDFVLTEIIKYPNCAEVPSGDIPRIIINFGKDEIMNEDIDIEAIPDVEHPLVLPTPMYLKKGTYMTFSSIKLSNEDVRIGLFGFQPLKDTRNNPILFKRPYFAVAKFTNVVSNTPIEPYTIQIEDWELFTITKIFAVVRKKDTDVSKLITTEDNFNIKIEVGGKNLLHREGHRMLICGTPEHPKELNPFFEDITGTSIYVKIYPLAYGDAFTRTIHVIFAGYMRYDFEKMKSGIQKRK